MVATILKQKHQEIAALCRTHRVQTLWVFGSATTDAWDPETSDIDLLVDLGGYDTGVADRYLELADNMEEILGRRIDLVSIGGLRNNRRLREELERTRVRIYERDHSQALA